MSRVAVVCRAVKHYTVWSGVPFVALCVVWKAAAAFILHAVKLTTFVHDVLGTR